jgi:hypothetical protein
MAGGVPAWSVTTQISRLACRHQLSSTRPRPGSLALSPVAASPVAAGVPCCIALVASSDAITTASSISGSSCHSHRVATVNSRAVRADSGAGASPRRRRAVPGTGGFAGTGCREPKRSSVARAKAAERPWYMDRPPSLRLGRCATTGQRISYDATSYVQMQVHLHKTPRTSDRHPRNGAREIASFKSTAAERHPRMGGGLPQKEMNGGCGA